MNIHCLTTEEVIMDMFEMMYHRKQALYANDKRFVVNYSLEKNEQGFYLEVASTPFPPK